MNKHQTLSKVFKMSSMIIVPIVLLACLVCKWPVTMIVIALLASIVISSPAMLSLQVFVWLFQKTTFERGFIWMFLLSSIPVLSLIVAWMFADFVPGKIWFVLLLGMLSGYVGLLTNGLSVSQFFNSTPYERKENNSID
jgi:hypothetical protein